MADLSCVWERDIGHVTQLCFVGPDLAYMDETGGEVVELSRELGLSWRNLHAEAAKRHRTLYEMWESVKKPLWK